MELFLEFVLTIAISIPVYFIIVKFLPLGAKPVNCSKLGVEMENRDLGSEKSTGFDEKIGEDNGLNRELIKGEFVCPVLRNERCGSPRKREADKVDDDVEVCSRETEVFGEESFQPGSEEKVIDESSERPKSGVTEIELVNDEVGVSKIYTNEVSKREFWSNIIDEANENEVEEDDWEGIERTELERVFGAAVVYAGSKSNKSKFSNFVSDLKMQLYGLHKIATHGPCREHQPMALKVSARAKWNAWRQLGNMSAEMAMERYINLLSENIPDWTHNNPSMISRQGVSYTQESGKLDSDSEMRVQKRTVFLDGRNLEEIKPCVEGSNATDFRVQTQ